MGRGKKEKRTRKSAQIIHCRLGYRSTSQFCGNFARFNRREKIAVRLNFQPPNLESKMQFDSHHNYIIGGGGEKNCRLGVTNPFWRVTICISRASIHSLEAEIVWGCFQKRGDPPKRGALHMGKNGTIWHFFVRFLAL